MSKKKQAVILFVLFTVGLPLVLCVGAGSFLLVRWILAGSPPLVIAQDCMGDSISPSGTVLDSQGQPIEGAVVHARSVTGNYSASFDIEMLTDDEGQFRHSEGIFVFECDRIEYQVQADGFESQTQTFERHRMPSPELIFTLERTP